MSVTISIRDEFEATVQAGVWTAEDAIVLRILQTITPKNTYATDPNPDSMDYAMAMRAVRNLNGCKIIAKVPTTNPDDIPGKAY